MKEVAPEGQRRDLGALASGSARVPASGPRAAFAATPTPNPHHDAPPGGSGAGASGVSSGIISGVKMEEGSAETLAQQRDRVALALAHGPVRVDSHIKVEDSTSGEDTDGEGEGEGEGEEELGGEGGDGEGEEAREEGPGGEGGLVLLVGGAAHVPDDDGGDRGAPRRSTPADRTARARRGRRDLIAAADDEADVPAPKRKHGGARVGPSGRHGVHQLTGADIRKATPWLKWRGDMQLPGRKSLQLGLFATSDDAARAYDAEVRRRGWAHLKPLNFPQPEELAEYARERCDERGLSLSLAPDQPAGIQGASVVQGASGLRPPTPSAHKPGKCGCFGVTKSAEKCYKATPWRARAQVSAPGVKGDYVIGRFATKKEAAQAYDVEIRRRGWVHIKPLNFPDRADDTALPPSSAAAEAPGPE